MNAEEILKQIKTFLESQPEFAENEMITTPTMYDPTKLQYKVSFVMMKKVKDENSGYVGTYPRFEITVNDYLNRDF